MARRTRLRLSFVEWEFDDIDTTQLWEPGHMIYDWCARITVELEKFTKETAPPFRSHSRWAHRGTGNLNRGIHAEGRRTGPESYRLVLTSDAPYTKYVHGGTAFGKGGGFIYSHAGFAMKAQIDALYAAGGLHGRTRLRGEKGQFTTTEGLHMTLPLGTSSNSAKRLHLRVRGQLPNAFIVRGWNRTAEYHESLRAFQFVQPLGYLPGGK